jgi:lipopolysaccharide/colanic/teichoic acid biosynthesis glycosyltransferase
LLLLAPLLLVTALLIKLDSPGPVFFRQQRVGRAGRLFRIHKFRTMVADAPGLQITVGDDPRITRIGRWLRRTRVDELPQFVDVLLGRHEPGRPAARGAALCGAVPADLRDRALAVRPGITDPASLAYIDENALLAKAADPEREYVEVILPAKLRCAVEYAETATLWTDLRVLAHTLRRLASGA